MENKKVKNATPCTIDGIAMKSKLEVMVYKTLKELGFSPQYEPVVFTFWEGKKPITPFFDIEKRAKDSSGRKNKRNQKKFVSMKYTPDFIFDYNGITVIIEAKGWENDQFPIRKKLFRTFLDRLTYPVVYAEIFTKRQLLQFLNELKEHEKEFKNLKNIMEVKRKEPIIAVHYTGDNIDELVEVFQMGDYIAANYQNIDTFKRECERQGYTEVKLPNVPFPAFILRPNEWVIYDGGIPYVLSEEKFNETYEVV